MISHKSTLDIFIDSMIYSLKGDGVIESSTSGADWFFSSADFNFTVRPLSLTSLRIAWQSVEEQEGEATSASRDAAFTITILPAEPE